MLGFAFAGRKFTFTAFFKVRARFGTRRSDAGAIGEVNTGEAGDRIQD